MLTRSYSYLVIVLVFAPTALLAPYLGPTHTCRITPGVWSEWCLLGSLGWETKKYIGVGEVRSEKRRAEERNEERGACGRYSHLFSPRRASISLVGLRRVECRIIFALFIRSSGSCAWFWSLSAGPFRTHGKPIPIFGQSVR